MLWSTLYAAIGRKHMKITQRQHVHMLSVDQDGKSRITFLDLKHDTQGNPYLVAVREAHANPHAPLMTHRGGTAAVARAASPDGLKYDLAPVRGGWMGNYAVIQCNGRPATLSTDDMGECPIVFESAGDARKYRDLVVDGLGRLLNQTTGMSMEDARDYFGASDLYEIREATGDLFDDDQMVYVVTLE